MASIALKRPERNRDGSKQRFAGEQSVDRTQEPVEVEVKAGSMPVPELPLHRFGAIVADLRRRCRKVQDGSLIGNAVVAQLDPGKAAHRLAVILDLSRFRSGLLRAILAIKETGYGSDTQ